ncbi:FadR/GntR family transcriptional regulator [Pseudomonas veronii]|uniref:FadR/GntR family transcriptional regulator n=1 Tax=Pseudomonas veronii TaxID=76761 RepID=UPI002D76C24D|nr:GntR family transcriptional regulator [Pseudomonas veronii]WRU61154.1 GntR family transcriptional regulator [Pseudomonas veronii]
MDQLKERIQNGEWCVGARLPTEHVMAQELGVSRNTVREALRVLVFTGVVEVRQGSGCYLRGQRNLLDALKSIYDCDSTQTIETLRIIKFESVGLATERRTNSDLLIINEALNQIQLKECSSWSDYLSWQTTFNQCLVDASQNSALSQLYKFLNQIVENKDNHSSNITQHKLGLITLNSDIAQAIDTQNCKLALKACCALENALKTAIKIRA